VVARQPADTILRAEAAEAWNSIKQVIEHHLASEEEVVLPWMKSCKNFPPDLILRTCEQHTRLRELARTVDATSFITGSNEDVTIAGTALTAFAVCLDDVIDGEERDLFPMIQRCLYEESNAPATAASSLSLSAAADARPSAPGELLPLSLLGRGSR
ncbi:MAG TPA: hemerythrin domain-containing protein, partial [Candidatus Acidoferrum sp.]|nr:hemerythrin domain-containing protein [Candidatus Acidoferrum sp.]